MSGKRVFTKPVGPNAKYQPAVRIGFPGGKQSAYFDLRDIAEKDFGVKQATLCLMICVDFARLYKSKKAAGQHYKIKQEVMELLGVAPSAKSPGGAGRKAAKAGKVEK